MERDLVVKLTLGVVPNVLIFAVPLFLPAGTVSWWRAWVILAGVLIGTAWAIVELARDHTGLLEERFKPPIQKSQPLADKILVLLLLVTFLGTLTLTSLDVFHLHLMRRPDVLVSSLGLILAVAGCCIAYLGLRENAFAAPVVKYQQERHHTVVQSGVYSRVRHPMYAGGSLVMFGIPLWLESYAGALCAVLAVAALIARIGIEERFLRRELSDYDAYAEKVRYRLIPLVW